MNPTLTAEAANLRHAQLIADAADYRRSHAARLPRPRRTAGPRVEADRISRRPLNVFYSWLAAGQL